ncbi:hypothetical protein MNBD_GAMMA26-754 [hydrothermal vent metagenome]|uniref:Uncharacterized protein n=1 Tax=hydrothermal vent metagenome TaxID=652676 RepID=A0A3B1BAX4_9ZZZZ
MVTILIGFLLDGMISTGTPKKNIATAAQWAAQNLPDNVHAACTDPRFAFYAENRCTFEPKFTGNMNVDLLSLIKTEGYNYLLIRVKHKDKQTDEYLKHEPSLQLIKAFPNNKGDEARIYTLE